MESLLTAGADYLVWQSWQVAVVFVLVAAACCGLQKAMPPIGDIPVACRAGKVSDSGAGERAAGRVAASNGSAIGGRSRRLCRRQRPDRPKCTCLPWRRNNKWQRRQPRLLSP